MNASRREFLRRAGLGSAVFAWSLSSASLPAWGDSQAQDLFFDISLAEFSLFLPFQDGTFTNLEFPEMEKDEFGISAVEYNDVRVNLRSGEDADDWEAIAEYAGEAGLHVVVENHGGPTSDASWLAGVIEEVDQPNVGTLPDFGNFCIEQAESEEGPGECIREYDAYQGVRELMPHAQGVSAKSYRFEEDGSEATIDYRRMLEIVRESGFSGYVGIEYEGAFQASQGVAGALPPGEGIRATKQLLERVGAELS